MCLTTLTLICTPVLVIILLLFRIFKKQKNTIAFFHPNCSAGGGGEAVLWVIVDVLLKKYPKYKVIIYSVDTSPKDEILAKVKNTFGYDFEGANIQFCSIKHTYPFVIKKYPVLTLLFQSVGQLLCSFDALLKYTPEYFFDTTGCAFTFPFAWIAGCKILAYVHYPTISTDMLSVVEKQETAVNNSQRIAKSKFLSTLKVLFN